MLVRMMVDSFYKIRDVSVKLIPTGHQSNRNHHECIKGNFEVDLLEGYTFETTIGVCPL